MHTTRAYTVVRYAGIQTLIDLIRSAEQRHSVDGVKGHFDYFESYFNHLQLKTIVVERSYVDADYLEDFSSYYAKCHREYSSRCRRFHFFSREFDQTFFERLLTGGVEPVGLDSKKPLENELGYLGFSVIKPLSQTIFGRTCLKTYDCDARRYYPITRQYSVNLFGLNLSIETIAFQEQDTVVGACATAAVWSAFQCTGKIFQHRIPTPVEITKGSGLDLLDHRRILPSDGLNLQQIAQAIRSQGLEPEFFTPISDLQMAAICYAYNRCGIPVISLMPLYKIVDHQDLADSKLQFERLVAHHAICITGYSIPSNAFIADQLIDDGFKLRAHAIDRIYAHDDQIGPHARMMVDQKMVIDQQGNAGYSLSSDWTVDGCRKGYVRIGVSAVVIPVDPLIRINHSNVAELILLLNQVVFDLPPDFQKLFGPALMNSAVGWDIYLQPSNEFKTRLMAHSEIERNRKHEILARNLPKYVWVAALYIDDNCALKIAIDATDSYTGCQVVAVAVFNEQLFDAIVSRLNIQRNSVLHEGSKLYTFCTEIIEYHAQND